MISREKTKEIALKDANVAEKDARGLEIELDRDRGGARWEVDF